MTVLIELEVTAPGLTGVDQTVAKIKGSVQGARKEVQGFEQDLSGLILAFDRLADISGQALEATGGLLVASTQEFADFDFALTSAAIKAGETKEAISSLADEAKRLAGVSSQTPASALRAADSLIALGASAQEAEERLEGVIFLTDALRTVGATTELSAKVIQTGLRAFEDFGITATDVADKVTLLANTTAVTSSTGLEELQQAFSKNASTAAQLGISIEELLAAFGVLRDAGQEPERAATSLASFTRNILESRDALRDLGIDTLDENGKLIGGLDNLILQLKNAGLSTEEVIDLFGRQTASVLSLTQGYGGLVESVDALSSTQDNTADAVKEVNASLTGQVGILQGNLARALTEIGEIVSVAFIPLVRLANDLVLGFLDLDPAVQRVLVAFVGLGAALSAAALVISTVGSLIFSYQAATAALSAALAAQTAATATATTALSAQASITLAASSATGAYAAVLGGASTAAIAFSNSVIAITASLTALAPLVATVAGAAGLVTLIDTTRELRRVNQEIGVNGVAIERTTANSLRLTQSLRDVNRDIADELENQGTVSDELLNKQRQLRDLGQEQLEDIRLQIREVEALIAEVEGGEGTGLFGLGAEASEAQLNALINQRTELELQQRVLTRQVEESTQSFDELGESGREAVQSISDRLDDLNSRFDRQQALLETRILDEQAEVTANLLGNAELRENELTRIQQDGLIDRLGILRRRADELRGLQGGASPEEAAEIEEEITSIVREEAQTRLEINRIAARQADELSREREKRREEEQRREEERINAIRTQLGQVVSEESARRNQQLQIQGERAIEEVRIAFDRERRIRDRNAQRERQQDQRTFQRQQQSEERDFRNRQQADQQAFDDRQREADRRLQAELQDEEERLSILERASEVFRESGRVAAQEFIKEQIEAQEELNKEQGQFFQRVVPGLERDIENLIQAQAESPFEQTRAELEDRAEAFRKQQEDEQQDFAEQQERRSIAFQEQQQLQQLQFQRELEDLDFAAQERRQKQQRDFEQNTLQPLRLALQEQLQQQQLQFEERLTSSLEGSLGLEAEASPPISRQQIEQLVSPFRNQAAPAINLPVTANTPVNDIVSPQRGFTNADAQTGIAILREIVSELRQQTDASVTNNFNGTGLNSEQFFQLQLQAQRGRI